MDLVAQFLKLRPAWLLHVFPLHVLPWSLSRREVEEKDGAQVPRLWPCGLLQVFPLHLLPWSLSRRHAEVE